MRIDPKLGMQSFAEACAAGQIDLRIEASDLSMLLLAVVGAEPKSMEEAFRMGRIRRLLIDKIAGLGPASAEIAKQLLAQHRLKEAGRG